MNINREERKEKMFNFSRERMQINPHAGIISTSAEGCFKANHHGQIALLFTERIHIKPMFKVKQSQVDAGEHEIDCCVMHLHPALMSL